MVWALRVTLLIYLSLFLAPAPTRALSLGGPVGEAFSLSLDPAAPAAHSVATLTPIPGDIDTNGASMTVVIAGKEAYSGSAAPLQIRTGGAGVSEDIKVTIKTPDGRTYSQVVTVTPQDVALVVEPLSSAPPLYLGKPAIPVGGSVRLVAVADLRSKKGVALDPATLAYTWTVDGDAAIGASGVDKRTVIVDSPLEYRSSTVSVTVTSPDGTLVASDSVDLIAAEPVVRLYERDPLLGIRFDKALGDSFKLAGSETTLYAAPFSFPTALGNPLLTWFVNGDEAENGSLITLRPTGGRTGTASVSFTAASQGSVDAPSASSAVSLSFGSGGGTSVFGL